EEEGQQSLECIQANQIFPKKSPVLEEENMQVPFPELHGEFTEYVGRAEDAIIATSNYRLHIKFKESVVNVPLQLIESAECRDMFQLHVTCKDCKVIRCQFSTFEQCQEWLKRLSTVVRPPSRLEDLFSFAFHAWCMNVYAGEKEQHSELCRPGEHVTSWFKNEVERMGFDTQNAWRISDINSRFRLCPSYPQQLLVPAWITDKELENVATFRSWKRIPAVVYRHQTTGAVIARCGQPEVSWWGWRNADDEHLVQSIAKACAVNGSSRKHLSNGGYANGHDLPDSDFESSMTNNSEVETLAIQPHKLLILDARSYAAAVANRAKGGGCECPEYYPNCEVVFMGMANIHSIRKSFQSLRFLCTQMPDPANWLSALESTKWLQHLSLLLKAALLVHAVDRDHRPVLVHCSDGWDRTPQIVALSKLLLDPYYRTVEGFQVLVETEWLEFGHKFADRCGHGENSEDLNERCPVFLQWDCVHQLQRQFPCSFEFNEAFLVKLVQHTYSCLFGTFLCNSGKERVDLHIQERTCSVWSLLRPANRSLRNMLYSSHSEIVLHPVCHVRNLMLWTAVYLPSSSPTTPSDDSCAPYPVPGGNPEDTPLARCSKTRSFDNLPSACETGSSLAPNRRSSDPSLNEKWQDHRRSLELSVAVGPDGGGGQNQEEQPGGAEEEAELSVAVGVAEGQMENILQEATKEEVAADSPKEESDTRTHLISTGATEVEGDAAAVQTGGCARIQGEAAPAGSPPENGETAPDDDDESDHLLVQQVEEDAHPVGEGCPSSGEPVKENCSDEEEFPQGFSKTDSCASEPSPHRTLTNGFADNSPEETAGDNRAGPLPDSRQPLNKRPSLMESSTETLTEEAGGRGPESAPEQPAFLNHGAGPDGSTQESALQPRDPRRPPETAGPELGTPAAGSLPPPAGGDLGRDGLVNGEGSEGELCPGPQWAKGSGDRAPLSRQVSLASCSSLILHPREQLLAASLVPVRQPFAISPEQPSRSHLDDDGLAVHTDVIQQRLRQIEAGHQLEVENVRKQMQELWSRLKYQQHSGSHRINGDMGDELACMTDSEYNVDPNCLSRCSTEFFSEASWEQVDKQDTEVTRWFPDHLAAQCYGCESRFWLAARKHHCSELGNVFCACCDQKIPVPSQQLFEPNRVCKSCYSSLQLSPAPLDLELDKPIAASSN
uniref:phosphatidylinositol-3,5-bisphosphate 3-phosphatase n=1 Tax=Tetraodon nigroviridis TaxID=99883 RepID=H3D1L3_TETNG